MSDRTSEFDDLQRAIRRAGVPSPRAGGACLNDAEIAAFVESGGSQTGRADAIGHIADCAHCRALYVDLVATLADAEVAHARGVVADDVNQSVPAASRTGSGRRPRVLAWAGLTGLAAAALVFVFLQQPASPDESSLLMRDGTSGSAIAPTAVFPRGATAKTSSFHWRPMDGAESYRLTVFTTDGIVVWEGESSDTTLALPTTEELREGETYLWRVQARTSFNRWTSSGMMEFRIEEGSGR